MKPIAMLAVVVTLAGCKSLAQLDKERFEAGYAADMQATGIFPPIKVGDSWPDARAQIKAAQFKGGSVVIGDYARSQIGDVTEYVYEVSRPSRRLYYSVLVQNDTVVGVAGPT